ncbi:MAG: PAS domain-containing protein [Candidatus Eremiobacteraeota bacterium]|nr:PAS domain-containing protein [Candidatus Eremiobacteraeota bacterium]
MNERTQAASDASFLAALADAVPQIVFVDNAAGVPEYWNARWYEYTGLTPEQSIGPERYSMVHPDDRAELTTQWPRALKQGAPFEMELRMLRANDRTYRWHLSRVLPLCDENGTILRWYGTLTDIDDQKRVELALRFLSDAGNRFANALSVQQTLQSLAESAIEGFADWCGIYRNDASDGIPVVAIAHKDPQKVALARQFVDAFPVRSGDAISTVVETGEPLLMPRIDDEMVRAQAQDPLQVRMLLELGLRSAMILPLKAGGATLGAISLVSSESGRRFDERDLRLAEALAQRASLAWSNASLYESHQQSLQAALESEQRFRTLSESIPALVWVCEPNGQLRYANHQWLDYFGFALADLDKWTLRSFLHPDDFERANSRWKHSLQTGDPYEVEYRTRNARGTYEWFLVRGDALFDDDGRVIRWFGTSTRIEDQKQAFERQRLVADTLQDAFIPKLLPAVPGVVFDAAYFPAEVDTRVGGDWYDATQLSEQLIVFSIGDVCGHGLEAAIAMGRVRQAIVGAAIDAADPGEVLAKINRLLLLQDAPIVTAIVGFIDLRRRVLVLASAGHPPALVARQGSFEEFLSGDLPLGVDPRATYRTATYTLESELFVTLYTDGLTEARRHVEIDEPRVVEAVKRARRGEISAAQIREAVLEGTPCADDVAILTVRIDGASKSI